MQLHYEVDGLPAVTHDMLAMGERALEPGPVLNLIGKAMQRIEQGVFDSGGYGAWPPLAASTVARKGHDKILFETGALMDSLTGDSGGSLFEVNGDELIFGTNIEYAGFHKTGTRRMPKRDPLPMPTEADLLQFTKAIQAYIIGLERAEFGAGSWSLGSLDPFGL